LCGSIAVSETDWRQQQQHHHDQQQQQLEKHHSAATGWLPPVAMTIFCVGGVSGSGKTTLINSHHILQDLPCWDIANYYRAAEEAGRSINPRQACKSMMYHISCYLRRYPAADIVVEAAFAPEGEARER
jgi:hypothetical protein